MRLGVILFLLATACAPFGCAGPAATTDPLSVVPQDFSIDMTILAGRKAQDEFAPAHRRQGKVIVLADGTLHADWGSRIGWGTRPGTTRTLRREQVSELWALVRQIGFADPAAAEQPGNLGLMTPEPSELLYLVAVTGAGDRWSFAQVSPNDATLDPAFTRLSRALAALAWEADATAANRPMAPVRYDFGPDPYVRYRGPATAPDS